MNNEIAKIYENIKTPEELMIFMDQYIKYGIHGIDGKDYIPTYGDNESNQKFQEASFSVYSFGGPSYILKYGLGHCWDQVELERDWFTKHHYECKTIYIWITLDYENSYSFNI